MAPGPTAALGAPSPMRVSSNLDGGSETKPPFAVTARDAAGVALTTPGGAVDIAEAAPVGSTTEARPIIDTVRTTTKRLITPTPLSPAQQSPRAASFPERDRDRPRRQ